MSLSSLIARVSLHLLRRILRHVHKICDTQLDKLLQLEINPTVFFPTRIENGPRGNWRRSIRTSTTRNQNSKKVRFIFVNVITYYLSNKCLCKWKVLQRLVDLSHSIKEKKRMKVLSNRLIIHVSSDFRTVKIPKAITAVEQ